MWKGWGNECVSESYLKGQGRVCVCVYMCVCACVCVPSIPADPQAVWMARSLHTGRWGPAALCSAPSRPLGHVTVACSVGSSALAAEPSVPMTSSKWDQRGSQSTGSELDKRPSSINIESTWGYWYVCADPLHNDYLIPLSLSKHELKIPLHIMTCSVSGLHITNQMNWLIINVPEGTLHVEKMY